MLHVHLLLTHHTWHIFTRMLVMCVRTWYLLTCTLAYVFEYCVRASSVKHDLVARER